MHSIEKLKEQLCHELDDYASKDKLDIQSLQIIDTIAHTIKNLNKIIEAKEKEEYNYNNGLDGYEYGNDYNYRNRNMGDWRMNDYSTAGRYSIGNEEMIHKLRNLMAETRDEKTRHELQSFIDRMERM